MAGHMNNDGTAFTGSPTSVTNASTLYTALTSSRYTTLSNATFQQALSRYNESDFCSFYALAQTLVGDTQFTCWDWYVAKRMADYGMSNYNYRFNTPGECLRLACRSSYELRCSREDPVQLAASPYKGVMHTSDLYFLFDGTKWVHPHYSIQRNMLTLTFGLARACLPQMRKAS